MKKFIKTTLTIILMLSIHQQVIANEVHHKPFSLALNVSGTNLESFGKQVKMNLNRAGFNVVGEYSPYPQAKIFVITSNELKRIAAKTRHGGFGAVMKVSLVDTGNAIQLSYNNPTYLGLAYNMGSKLENIKTKLNKNLGYIKDFGGGAGIKESELPEYNYTFGLEGFTGFMELAEFKNHKQAIRHVEKGLGRGDFGIQQVFRVDVPGKQQTLFGLSMNSKKEISPYLNDAYVMQVIDNKPLKRLPHLPYEIMVDGNKVIALHPHYRLAVNFTDMRMFGEHSFGKLMDLPYAYEEYFIKSVGGQWPPPEQDW